MQIKLNKSDLFIIAIFYIVAIGVTLVGYDYSKSWFRPIMDTVVYCFFTAIVSYVIVFKFFPYFFPKRRILALLMCTAALMGVAGYIELVLYEWIDDGHWEWFKRTITNFRAWLWGISSSAQNAGILIGMLLGKKFYDAQLDIQEREKEKKESELRLLKSQIDPHFLFNNLNTLDSLIDNKPQVAKQYLQRLSQLYRYLIRTKDDEVVMLDEELEFAQNYIYLLEQRFGKAYQFEIENTGENKNKMIPPGALQTLLENVVKHNASSMSNPIITSVMINEKQIVVSNNIRLKKDRATSNQTGLKNLIARYQLLTDHQIKIIKDENFTVILPLIKEVGQ